MKIKEVRFEKSIWIDYKEIYFDQRSEIVFVGRSNVGKSSMMNTIFGRKNLVKTSSKPGKTRTANQFIVNNKYYFTDLPGYGYAQVDKESKAKIDALISWYIEERNPFIKKVVLIVDAKLWVQDSDISMFKYLSELEIPLLVVINKIDKLGKNEANKSLSHTESLLFGQKVMVFSATKRIWLDDVMKEIKEVFRK